jgi:parallel beta-helix repeat protein
MDKPSGLIRELHRRSIWQVLGVFLAAFPAPSAAQPVVPFTPGMTVTESVRIEPGTYETRGADALDEALIVVRGAGVTLDLTGVHLRGIPVEADPDRASGVAVRVEGGSDVTIRGGEIRGYRFGILARDVERLQVVGVDLSYSWKPRLFSQVGHESLVDWLSYHDNEERQWMRFGAAIYLERVRGGAIRDNRAVQGMNGLLASYSDDIRVENNDFSYNSGLGVGLYHANRNVIVRNLLDYNVRGYSEGFYQRGQDSAGILLYAQSSDNVIAYNSATHSGDGFFLWAGQSTMDTGEGGANDNLLFHNDFSYAPTNAVEVTFSRNAIVGNYLGGSRYGVWGGYSWETVIQGNCFFDNQHGVAIEHGQSNAIEMNRFDRDSLVISLWSRESEPVDWGYAQHKDTRSRGHRVRDNVFAANAELWRLERTSDHEIGANTVLPEAPSEPCDPRELLGSAFDRIAPDLPGVEAAIPHSARAALPRSAMVVDEWGPYEGRFPKLWPTDTARAEVRLAVLGPAGSWRVARRDGVARVSAESGVTGDTLVVTPRAGSEGDWSIELGYEGEAVLSSRGTAHLAGAVVPFGFERFDPTGPWALRIYAWTDPAADPGDDPAAFERLTSGDPILERDEARLDYQWFTPHIDGMPPERWAAVATSTVELAEGEYSIRTISDDGIRVWVDDELALDAFEPHGSRVDYAPIGPGRHELLVEYVQIGGWMELRLDIVRGRPSSSGSPGPH